MKPPKSWLSDYSNNKTKKDGAISEKEKSNKKSFGRDTDDSFRHYMARKIDLQRQQFGLVLPPDPKKVKTDHVDASNCHRGISDSCNQNSGVELRTDVDRIMDPLAIQPKSIIGDDAIYGGSRDEDEASKGITSISQGMNSVLSRLKEKHRGCGSRQKLSQLKMKKKRRKNLVMGDDDDDDDVNTLQQETTRQRSDDISGESEIKCSKNQDNSTYYLTTASPPQNSILDIKRQRKDLFFLGITVLVNGFTDPCADTIMRLMHKHGGDLEKYETSRVTHIIAENLSTAKAKIYKKQRNPIPVVKPKWIVDSVNAGKLLPHAAYLLDQVRNDNVGLTVKAFFPKQPSGCFASTGDNDAAADQGKEQIISAVHRTNDDDYDRHDDMDLHSTYADSPSLQNQDKYTQSPNAVVVPLMTQLLEVDDCNINREELSTPLKVDSKINLNSEERLVAATSLSIFNPGQRPIDVNSEENLAASVSPSILNTDLQPSRFTDSSSSLKKISSSVRTVGTDPNFLDSYFKSSRLSFIGSFKQRLEKSYQCRKVAARSGSAKRYVFHVDMDCFFAAVALRKYPQYKDKPVAVGHAWKSDSNGVGVNGSTQRQSDDKKKSYSELSTCNYKARAYGVKKGMFLHRARELCPELIVLPYDYDGYEDASNKVGDVLYTYVDEYHGAIEQVSCDESYLEFYFEDTDNIETIERLRTIGDQIRKDILDETDCTASIGIGKNKLLAKLATNHVKDKGGNGIFIVEDWKCFLKDINLRNLPGVGYKMNQKLQDHGLTQVCDIWDISEGDLSHILGPKTASKLYKYCHGHDDRLVKPGERKTIGAECNYGVRFDGPYGVDHMIGGLAKEVEKRMNNVGVLGRHITLKVKVRQVGAGQPGKYNGHGLCDDHSKSCNLPGNLATRDSSILTNSAIKLYSDMELDKNDIRGMGIVISNLEAEKDENEPNAMSSWLRCGDTVKCSKTFDADMPNIQQNEPKPNEANQVPPRSNMTSLITTPSTFSPHPSSKSCHKKSKVPRAIQGNHMASAHREVKIKNKGPAHKTGLGFKRYDGRYRQFDVKCMLNLASIKSGDKKLCLQGEEVSLTQLDALPLELQLQVANNTCSEESMPSITSSRKRACHDKKSFEAEYPEKRASAIESSLKGLSRMVSNHDTFQDIIFLSRWMDDHKIPLDSHIQIVVDYLCICIKEKRLDDTIKFLRLIRNRSDAWEDNYKRFLKAVETEILRKTGRKLDIIGLGL